MASKKKKYIPQQRFNPALLYKKLENLKEEVLMLQKVLNAVNQSNSMHVEHLSNFVRHDMKNAIQGLDGIIYNAKNSGRTDEDLVMQLDTALKMLQGSLDGFTKLIPSSKQPYTTLQEVLNAVDMLSRGEAQQANVSIIFDYNREGKDQISSLPFQTLVQLLHNMVLNALNSCSAMTERHILISGNTENGLCNIRVYDNGPQIPESLRLKIYEYGYSTTGGTGIGLFHAKNVIDKAGGSINVLNSEKDLYSKYFDIIFATNRTQKDEQDTSHY